MCIIYERVDSTAWRVNVLRFDQQNGCVLQVNKLEILPALRKHVYKLRLLSVCFDNWTKLKVYCAVKKIKLYTQVTIIFMRFCNLFGKSLSYGEINYVFKFKSKTNHFFNKSVCLFYFYCTDLTSEKAVKKRVEKISLYSKQSHMNN